MTCVYGDDRVARIIHPFTINIPRTHNAIRKPIALVLLNNPGVRKRGVWFGEHEA